MVGTVSAVSTGRMRRSKRIFRATNEARLCEAAWPCCPSTLQYREKCNSNSNSNSSSNSNTDSYQSSHGLGGSRLHLGRSWLGQTLEARGFVFWERGGDIILPPRCCSPVG